MTKHEKIAAAIGSQIRTARRAPGITPAELVRRIGEGSGRTISEWEHARCNPSSPKLLRVARALGVTPNYLYGIEDGARRLSMSESLLLEQYRHLDEDGRRLFDTLLGMEHERCARKALQRHRPSRRPAKYGLSVARFVLSWELHWRADSRS